MGWFSGRFDRVVGSIVLLALGASAQSTLRVSIDSNGAQGNNYSGTYGDAVSADGRFVAFGSGATNLVPGGSPLQWEIFLHDTLTGATSMVSVDSSGAPGPAGSYYPSISSDGTCVAFESDSGFGTGDTNGRTDVFVHDFTTGLTTRMSVDSNGNQWTSDSCHSASISGDGRYVAFHKIHPTTIYHHRTDVLVHDRQTGATTEVDVTPSGSQTLGTYSSDPSVSCDGNLIAFASTGSDLVAGDTNASYDVFVRDMQLGSTTRVSVDSAGAQGDGDSVSPSISSDGRYVAFSSVATNLVPGDVNGLSDIFVHDLQTGITVIASVDSGGIQANADCLDPSISSDGRFVVFHSTASNLVTGDTNNVDDVFVRDLLLGITERTSVGVGGQANGMSDKPAISADGRFVSFHSFASNLVAGDTNGTYDVFERDRGAAVAIVSFCGGDGTGAACPCGNSGALGHGCENSASTGGASLTGSGSSSLSTDTVQFQTTGELPSALSIVIQGNGAAASVHFGDGLRCAGGSLKRLYVHAAVNGSITAPQAGDASVSARSAALGDPIPFGATRIYQVYYRDPNASFCPDPPGGTFNVSNAVAIVWEE